jgi:alpha-beta hydrolase superfamily lysophospholipase
MLQRAMACLLICSLVIGCAPQEQAYHPAETGDISLPQRSWLPKGKPKAVVIALHGFNDYSHAFEATGTFLKGHGIAVIAYDQRGFGKAPDTGVWANEKNLVADLAAHVKQASRRWPHTPVYILGESMGGAVAAVAVTDPEFPKVNGIILSAPALWPINPFYHSVLWTGAHTWPSHTLTGHELHILASDNIPMLQALGRDPLVIKHTRIDAIYGLVELMDDAYQQVPQVKTPVLFLYGAHDEVIPSDPIEESRTRFSMPITYRYYPDGYHMLLRDLERHKVMQDVLGWIEQTNPPKSKNKF